MKVLLIVISLFFISAAPVFASAIITEVHPQPASGGEWVELFNPTNEPISLAGWYLEDEVTTPSTIYQFYPTDEMAPQTYSSVEIVNRLNNSGDGIKLKNNQGQVIDAMSYSTSEQNLSWSLIEGQFVLSAPSRNMANPVPPPSPSPSPSTQPSPTPSSAPSPSPPAFDPFDIVISEIMACPSQGEKEWLELYNPTDHVMTLSDWRISDWTGNSRSVTTTIAPQSYGVVNWLTSLLNNTGDSLFLENDGGQIIAAATFPACAPNQSFVWDANRWVLTTTPTANQVNQLTSLPSPSPSILAIPSPTPKASPKLSPPSTSILGLATTQPLENSPSPKLHTLVPDDPQPSLTAVPALTREISATQSASKSASFIQVKPVPLSWLPPFSVILGGTIMAISSAYLWYDEHRDIFDQLLA